MEKCDIRSLNYEQLQDYIVSIGEKPFRAKQLYDWMHVKLAASFDEMTNLSKALRDKLSQLSQLTTLVPAQILTSRIDGTQKYLFRLEDGHVIESVLMRYKHGNSVCISSQVGCRMGCRFCASTIGGRIRNLTTAEMLEQIYRIQSITGERVSNIVIMGTGEPLDNYDTLLAFLRMISDERGLNISQRNITVSTCGLAGRIRQLADEHLAITLALSLHAPSQEKRERLMPIALKYEIHDVLDACQYYFEKTGRRMTFEYSLVHGENDSPKDAGELIALIGKMNCHVNLIPVNPVEERSYKRPDKGSVIAFQKALEAKGVTATIRREMGTDINGACGQLRRSFMESGKGDV